MCLFLRNKDRLFRAKEAYTTHTGLTPKKPRLPHVDANERRKQRQDVIHDVKKALEDPALSTLTVNVLLLLPTGSRFFVVCR